LWNIPALYRNKHTQSERCKKWTTIKHECLESERNKIVMKETIFTISGTPIKTVDTFKYLGRILEKNDDDWPSSLMSNKLSSNGVESLSIVVDQRQSRPEN
jgi:hypothetical protein